MTRAMISRILRWLGLEKGKGSDLLLELYLQESLDDPLGSPGIRDEALHLEGLSRIAAVADAIGAKRFDHGRFAGSLSRDDLPGILQAATDVSGKDVSGPELNAAAAVALLYLPVCYIDAFSVSVVGGSLPRKPIRRQASDVQIRVQDWVIRNHTTKALHQLVGYGRLAWLQRTGGSDFGLDDSASRARFDRFRSALALVKQNAAAYREVIGHASNQDWRGAETAAGRYFTSAGIRAGTSIDDPPALADFLMMAYAPVNGAQQVIRGVGGRREGRERAVQPA
jgi:hypothetical protein